VHRVRVAVVLVWRMVRSVSGSSSTVRVDQAGAHISNVVRPSRIALAEPVIAPLAEVGHSIRPWRRRARIQTSSAVASAPTINRAIARWYFTVECDRPKQAPLTALARQGSR